MTQPVTIPARATEKWTAIYAFEELGGEVRYSRNCSNQRRRK